MPLEKQIGDAATALSQNQYIDALDGTYWIDGWDATLGAGDLEVDIEPGEGVINTESVETTEAQVVDFADDVDATNPRKAVISVDDTGTVQKTLGDAMPADPEGEVRERTFDPAPPTNAPGVVVAEVWLDAGASSLVSGDIRDRRVGNDAAPSPDELSNIIVTDPGEPDPPVGNRGDLWYPLLGGGDLRWSTSVDNSTRSLIKDENTVYASIVDTLHALDSDSGSIRWTFQAGSGISSGISVKNNRVYFGSDDNNIYSVSAIDGSEIWSVDTGNSVQSGVEVSDGRVYAGNNGGILYGLNASDGSEVWTLDQGFGWESNIVAKDATVYAGTSDFDSPEILALNASDGTETWSATTSGSLQEDLVLEDGVVYASDTDDILYAINASDGSEKWSFQSPSSIDSGIGVGDGAVYFGGNDNDIRAVNIDDGTERWSFTTGSSVQSGIKYANGLVHAGSFDNNIYGLDSADGTVVWSFDAGGGVDSGVALSDGVLHFGSRSDNVYSVVARSGDRQKPTRVSNGDEWIVERGP